MVSDVCYRVGEAQRCVNTDPGFHCLSCPHRYKGTQPFGMGVEAAKKNKQVGDYRDMVPPTLSLCLPMSLTPLSLSVGLFGLSVSLSSLQLSLPLCLSPSPSLSILVSLCVSLPLHLPLSASLPRGQAQTGRPQ